MVYQQHSIEECTDPQTVVVCTENAGSVQVTTEGYEYLHSEGYDVANDMLDPRDSVGDTVGLSGVERDAEGLVHLVQVDSNGTYISRNAEVVEVPCGVDWVIGNENSYGSEYVDEVSRTWS